MRGQYMRRELLDQRPTPTCDQDAYGTRRCKITGCTCMVHALAKGRASGTSARSLLIHLPGVTWFSEALMTLYVLRFCCIAVTISMRRSHHLAKLLLSYDWTHQVAPVKNAEDTFILLACSKPPSIIFPEDKRATTPEGIDAQNEIQA